MKDLIEALQLMQPYLVEEKHPTWCEHDALHVAIDEKKIPEDVLTRLKELGFTVDPYGGMVSYRFGSC